MPKRNIKAAYSNFVNKKRAKRPLFLPNVPKRLAAPVDQGNYILDKLSVDDIERYVKIHNRLKDYFLEEHFYFVTERAKKESQIIDSLNQRTQMYKFSGYFRCVASQYNDKPLSSAGSRISRVGGRFNVGDIGAAAMPFPALYAAETAYASKSEFFQKDPDTIEKNSISLEDFFQQSVSINRIHGELSCVIDITNTENLKPFLKVISKIIVDQNLIDKAIAAGLKSPSPNIKTMKELVKALTTPSWRNSVISYDIPSNSQMFGELARKAKIEGIVYESKFANAKSIAIFPENLGKNSFVRLSDPAASGVITCLDQNTARDLT